MLPNMPDWAYGDPTFRIQPSAGKQATGWLSGERPPFQYMNWVHYQSARFFEYLQNKIEANTPTLLRSAGSLAWDGSQITFGSNIDISFRVRTGEQVNRISSAASPIALADGQVLVMRKNKTGSSPVAMSSDTYGVLDPGEYAIVAESSLSAANEENESVIFRRVGTNLEIQILGIVVQAGSTFRLGEVFNPGGLPVGSIIPFYDFNAAVTFDANFYRYCDGSVLSYADSPLNGLTLPDLSGRYLVGFGTVGAGDIDTATWATVAIGSNSLNLQHAHDMGNHTHSIGNHTHAPGTLRFESLAIEASGGGWDLSGFDSGGTSFRIAHYSESAGSAPNGDTPKNGSISGATTGYTRNGTGATDTASGTSGTPSTNNTSNALSTTQDIRPSSIRVRYIIKVR